MPSEDYNPIKFCSKPKNGEYQPVTEISELLLKAEDISNDAGMDYSKEFEFSFELNDNGKEQVSEFIKPFKKVFDDIEKLLKRTLLCNNWRKMHHLPLIRRRGKRC